jgi:hypothetical protein
MIFSFILWFIVYTYVFMLLYALAGKRLVCDKFRFIQFIKTHTGFLSLFLVYVVIAFFIMSALYYFVISQYVSWASIAIFGIGGVLVVIMYSIILVEHVYLMKAE